MLGGTVKCRRELYPRMLDVKRFQPQMASTSLRVYFMIFGRFGF